MTVYYPWRRQGSLQPILRQKQFNEVVYSRNSGIISQEAQQRLARIKVLIVGAGVGGNIAKMLAMTGVQNFVIVDAGTVDLHNLNRTSYAGVPDLGVDLATLVSREIKELNPYANVEKHNALLSVDGGPPNMNGEDVATVHFGDVVQGCEVLIEGVDNLFMKYVIQMSALRTGLVTLMPSDLGMGANLKVVAGEPFNGNLAFDQMMQQIGIIQQASPDQQYRLMTDLAREIIGEKNVPLHMLEAIKVAVENNFGFYPQTGVAAALAASLVTEQIIQFAESGTSLGARDVTIDIRPLR
jgi:molybdopterin/thiamine biosynthesis adenylyltransferase